MPSSSFKESSCSRHGSITPWPLSASPRCFEYHSRILSRLADLKNIPPIPRMRPRCSILTGGFDFSGCGDCTSCPPFEQTEMSNSEPSAIVLQGIPCMCGLYKFRFEWRNGSLKVRRAAIAASFKRLYTGQCLVDGWREATEGCILFSFETVFTGRVKAGPQIETWQRR